MPCLEPHCQWVGGEISRDLLEDLRGRKNVFIEFFYVFVLLLLSSSLLFCCLQLFCFFCLCNSFGLWRNLILFGLFVLLQYSMQEQSVNSLTLLILYCQFTALNLTILVKVFMKAVPGERVCCHPSTLPSIEDLHVPSVLHTCFLSHLGPLSVVIAAVFMFIGASRQMRCFSSQRRFSLICIRVFSSSKHKMMEVRSLCFFLSVVCISSLFFDRSKIYEHLPTKSAQLIQW